MEESDYYKQALKAAKGKNPDFEKAASLLKKAAKAGSGDAFFALGNWYFHGRHFAQDMSLAITNWERGAALKNVDSMLELGKLFERGEHVSENLETAFYHYLNAALAGSGQGSYEVSRFFYYGFYVPKNEKISDLWRDRAEDLGFEEADEE